MLNRDIPKMKILNGRRNHPPRSMVAILFMGVLVVAIASYSSPNQIFVRAQNSPNDQRTLMAIISKGADVNERSLQINKKYRKTRRNGNTNSQNTGTGPSTSGPGMQGSTTQQVAGGDGVSGVTNPQAHHRGANKKLKVQNKIRTKRTTPKQQPNQTIVERYSNENETSGGTNTPGMSNITSTFQYGFFPLMDSRTCAKMDKSPNDKIELSSTITRCCKLHFNGYAVDCIIHSMQFADQQHSQPSGNVYQQHSQPPGNVYDARHNEGMTGDRIGSKSGKGGKSFKSGKADSSWYGWQVPPPLPTLPPLQSGKADSSWYGWQVPPSLPPLMPSPPIESIPPIETTPPTQPGSTYIPTCE